MNPRTIEMLHNGFIRGVEKLAYSMYGGGGVGDAGPVMPTEMRERGKLNARANNNFQALGMNSSRPVAPPGGGTPGLPAAPSARIPSAGFTVGGAGTNRAYANPANSSLFSGR